MARTPIEQLALLDWQPPEPVTRFPEQKVRAASLGERICRAITLELKECGRPRHEVASRMSDYLGQSITPHILNAYASQAREDHVINLVRFVALLHATQDRRLLEMIAEQFGWAVIDRRFLKLIDIAALQEREDALRKQRELLRREAKAEGTL